MKVTAFTKYDREAASTRQRILQYAEPLAQSGIALDYHPLLSDEYVRSLALGSSFSRLDVIASYVRRLAQILRKPRCDVIWVYAELFPYLPAFFERLVFRSGVPVVVDCDDAFFLAYDERRGRLARAMLAGKLEPLFAGAAAATCGNDYLRRYAERFCPRAITVPTVVDTALYRPTERGTGDTLVVGWIGSPSSWTNVRPMLPVLRQVCADRAVRFVAVGAGADAERDCFPGMELTRWSSDAEIAAVQAFDIGIMPLADAPFQKGKSGYKLIQYMACGLPVVASPVGVNRDIVEDGGNGFLASSDEEWRAALTRLIDDADLRRRMGAAGRAKVERRFSLQSQAPRLVELFRSLAR